MRDKIKTEPIKPSEINSEKNNKIPDIIIEIFNTLLIENWDGREVIIHQSKVLELISKDGSICKIELFKKHWLDIEDLYRKSGWKVEYDKPGYCETYEPFWRFSQ